MVGSRTFGFEVDGESVGGCASEVDGVAVVIWGWGCDFRGALEVRGRCCGSWSEWMLLKPAGAVWGVEAPLW